MFKFSNRNKWLRQMELFADFVDNFRDRNTSRTNRTIKVAVLDDGFTLIDNLDSFKQNKVYGAIFDGEMDEGTATMSLQGSDGAAGGDAKFPQAEFYSRRGHGNLMTQLIRKIFPKAEFYIAKLEDVGGSAKGPKTRAAIQVYAYLHMLTPQACPPDR